MYWGLVGTLGTRGPEGVSVIRGHWGSPRGCRGPFGCWRHQGV